MAPLHSLCPDDQNEMQHGFFGHVMTLVSALISHDSTDAINGTTAFFRSRQSK